MMNFEIKISLTASKDLLYAKNWYNDQKTGLGDAFLVSTEASFKRIQQNPKHYQLVFKDYRSTLVNRFPFRIIFYIEGNLVIVNSIVHTHRDPSLWQK